jgi:hypothetical protein
VSVIDGYLALLRETRRRRKNPYPFQCLVCWVNVRPYELYCSEECREAADADE